MDEIYLEAGEDSSRFLSSTEYALLEIKKIQESQPLHPDADASPVLEPVMRGFTSQMILKQGQAESRGLRKSQQGESVLGCNGTITVSGYVYYDAGGTLRPLINASVYLYDDDTIFCGGDDLLASTVTDWDGHYQFSNIDNCDCDGTVDMYLKVMMWNTEFRVINPSENEPYTHITPTTDNIPPGTHIRDMTVPYPGAGRVFAAMNLAWAEAAASQWPGDIHARYPEGSWPATDTNVDPPVIYYPGGNWPDYPDVVQHEYAHGLMRKAYGSMPAGSGGGHTIEGCYNQGLAWSEGWSNFYPQVVNNDNTLDDPYGSVNLESPPSYFCQGPTNEARVAGALLDLWDYSNDGNDQNASYTVPLSTLWAEAMWGQRQDTFIDYWENMMQYLSCSQVIYGEPSIENNTINVIGYSPLSVTISGPDALGWKEQGTWTAHASGCNGSYAYEWRWRYNGVGPWSEVVDTDSTYSRRMLDTDFELQVRVTSQEQIAYDTHYVDYGYYKIAEPPLAEDTAVPKDFTLLQNFPNPFNPETEIRFGLPEDAHVKLVVIDLLGREIRELVDGNMKAGYHSVIWDGRDNAGNAVPSGIYLYQITAGTFRDWKKSALVR